MGQWRFMCVVCCYHVYKELWEPLLNDELTTKHQRNNLHDKYAVAVLKADAEIVGHLPRELSKVCCLFFLHGGTITGVVKGRRRKIREPCGGMEIPCELTCRHTKRKMLDKLKCCIATKYHYTP